MDLWLGRLANATAIVGFCAVVISAAYAWWAIRCDRRWCLRRGDHCVDETTMKVCDAHHTPAIHDEIRRQEERRDPRRMGWGQS